MSKKSTHLDDIKRKNVLELKYTRRGYLTRQEQKQFKEARLAEERARKIQFVLGGPITKSF